VAAFEAAIAASHGRLRLAVLDLILSFPPVILPVQRLCKLFRYVGGGGDCFFEMLRKCRKQATQGLCSAAAGVVTAESRQRSGGGVIQGAGWLVLGAVTLAVSILLAADSRLQQC
jgi:hypothetical protein